MLKTTVRVGLPKKEGEEERRWIYIKNAGLEMIRAAVTGRGLGLNGTDEGVLVELCDEPKSITLEAFKHLYPRKGEEKGPSLAKTSPPVLVASKVVTKKIKTKRQAKR